MTTLTATPTARTTSPRSAALIAGVSYLLLTVLGVFANFFVREALIVDGDAIATAANILESQGLFRAGMIAFLAVFALDIVVAWALHVVFRDHHHDLSLLTAWFRVAYSVLLGVAVAFFVQADQLLGGAAFLDGFTSEQLAAQALVALDTFNATWLIGLAAFGLHVALLGYMVIRFRVASRILGWVLVVAGSAYVIDTVANLALANYAEYAHVFVAIVAIPAVVGELWMAIWLLARGGKRGPAADADAPPEAGRGLAAVGS